MNFGQDAGHTQYGDVAFAGSVLGDFEERRFPDPGLAADDECRSTLIDPVDQMIDQGNVLLSALQDAGREARDTRALFLLGASASFSHAWPSLNRW